MGESALSATAVASASTESPAESTPAFVLPDIPYSRMLDAQGRGDTNAFDAIVGAMEMGFGATSDVVIKVFETRLKGDKVKVEIAAFQKELTGISVGKAIVTRMAEAIEIATGGDGTVSFSLVLSEDKESAAVVARFSGIAGASGGGGSTGRRNSRYSYFDNGTLIEVQLKKYLLANYPDSHAGRRIADHDSGKKKGNVSAWVAAQDGMAKHSDTFVITRTEKPADDGDKASS